MFSLLPLLLVVALVVIVLACFVSDAAKHEQARYTPPVQTSRTHPGPSRISPLIVVLVIGVLTYYFFGSQIAAVFPLIVHGR